LRFRLVQAFALLTFALVPVWYRLRGAPGDFDRLYLTGFLIFWPMLGTVAAWLLTGLPGFAALRRDPIRRGWALALLALVIWGFASWGWAFTRAHHPDVAVGAALQFGLVVLFALAVACAGPPPRAVVGVFILSLVWNSLLAIGQVAAQHSLGLRALGEYPMNPANSGTIVVQAGAVRWLRPYALLPHPNMLAAVFAIGLCAALAWALSRRGWVWPLGIFLFLVGLWAFLLTFSRAAWIGFAAGAFAALPLLWRWLRRPDIRTQFALVIGLALLVSGVFVLLYRPFLAARAGLDEDSPVEQRSVSDRAVYTDLAYMAIESDVLKGVGFGNFPWYAAYQLQFTPFDLQGQPVHHVLLSAWAELGLVGVVLVTAALVLGVEGALRLFHATNDESAQPDALAFDMNQLCRAALYAGFVALTIIGLLDHYPWTLLQFQIAWWGLLAAASTPVTPLHSPASTDS
jgi:O-antigen ligase